MTLTDGAWPGVTPDTGRLDIDVVMQRGDFQLKAGVVVAPGEVLGVLGPNGAGKSTLLRALAGLAAVSAGRILLGAQVLDDAAVGAFVPAEQRPVGLVFQDYRLFPHLSVRDNVAFAARSRGARRTHARRHADRFLAQLGLTGLAHRKPAQLSGGQAQRVALARALAANPALLLLDEPLAALDARTRLDVRTELRRHLADFGGPVLLVTHDPLEAMVMTDRLLVIEDGKVVQEGTPNEVARRPATQYVARLVGLNLYPGRAVSNDGTVQLTSGGTLIAAPTDPIPGSGDEVLVALRPSAIAVHTEHPEHGSPRNIWQGTIGGLEMLADRVRAQVEGRPNALVDLTPASVAELNLRPGMHVWLTAKATEVDIYPDVSVAGGPASRPRQA
jgi:molybdate transport system ATP-binding protein